MKKLTLIWLYAAGMRALRTMAQTAVSLMTVGAAVSDINWSHVVSVSIVAGVLSILTSISTNLPELSTTTQEITNTEQK